MTDEPIENSDSTRPKTARERLEEHEAGREVLELEVRLEELKEGETTDSDEYRAVKLELRNARQRHRALRDGQVIIEDHKGRPFAVAKGRADVVAEAFDAARQARDKALDAAEAAAETAEPDNSPDATVTPGTTEAGGGANDGSTGGDAR